MSLTLTNNDGSLFVNNSPLVGPTGPNGVNAATSISYNLESTSGGNVSGPNYFTTSNTYLPYTNIFVFAYTALNDISSEGVWNTVDTALTNGQIVYLQITELGNPSVTLLSVVNSVVYSDHDNEGQYTVTCDLPPISATGFDWNVTSTYVVSFNIAGSIGDTGPTGLNGVNAATSISYNLQSTSGGDVSSSQNFTTCCNANLIYTNIFVFAYFALNNISSEGIWNTVEAVLINGQTAYLQITELGNPSVTLLSKINSVVYSDPGNGGQYTVTCDLPVCGSGAWNTSRTYVISFNFSGPQGPQGSIVLNAINLSSYSGLIDGSGNLFIDLSDNTINMCINDVEEPLNLYVNGKLLYSLLQNGANLPVNVYNNGIAYTTGLAT